MTGASGVIAAVPIHAAVSPVAAMHSSTCASAAASHSPAWIPQWISAGWPADYLPPLVALAAFLWSLWVFISAKRRERFKLGIDLMMKLGERFESTTMREHRATAAAALAAKRKGNITALDSVLDFFEEVAFLRRRGAVDVEAVYEYFSYWLELYGRSTTLYRADRALVWEGFNRLVPEVAQFEDWKLSRWRLRWRSRTVHSIAWHLFRGSDESRNWNAPNADTEAQLQAERRLAEAASPDLAAGRRRVKRLLALRRECR